MYGNQRQVDRVRVAPGDSLRHVLKVLDASATRIVLVTDAERRLHGVVTDGDVRRSLLEGASLDVPAEAVMTRDPLVEDERTDRARLEREVRRRGVLAVPQVRAGAVVGLRFCTGPRGPAPRDNLVVLMAGGRGSRLMPLTEHCPKPLLRVGDTPIVERVLGQLRDCGFRRFRLCVSYLSEQIEEHFGDGSDHGVDIDYVREERPLGTAGALSLIEPEALALPALVMNADILTTLCFSDIVDSHAAEGAALTVATREYSHEIPFGVVDSEGGTVTGLAEKPTIRRDVSAGIYVVDARTVATLERGRPCDMPALIERTVAAGRPVRTFPVHEYWLDIGRTSELERARLDVRELAAPGR